jgi:hypothetical protein
MTHNTLVVSLANHEPGLVLDKYIPERAAHPSTGPG